MRETRKETGHVLIRQIVREVLAEERPGRVTDAFVAKLTSNRDTWKDRSDLAMKERDAARKERDAARKELRKLFDGLGAATGISVEDGADADAALAVVLRWRDEACALDQARWKEEGQA